MTILAQRTPYRSPGVPLASAAAPTLRARPAPAFDFTVVRDLAGLEALRNEWKALFAACGQPHQVFQTYAWLSTWARIYLDDRTRPAIVVGRSKGRLVLIWPMVERRTLGLRLLTGMGEPASQYTDALVDPALGAGGLEAAWAFVRTQRVDAIAMRRVRADAALSPLLRSAARLAQRAEAPFLAFDAFSGSAAFAASFPGKLRSSRRRRRRLAEAQGALTLSVCGASPEAAAHVVTALAFKRAWAVRKGAIAPALRDPRFEHFFVAAALGGDDAPDLRICVLRSGARTVGIEIAVACRGWLFGHVLAPDPDALIPGLGGLLAEMTLSKALEDGALAYDLLAPADPYKLEWTTSRIEVCDYTMARTIGGWLYTRLWLEIGRPRAKAVLRRLRPLLERRQRDGVPFRRAAGE